MRWLRLTLVWLLILSPIVTRLLAREHRLYWRIAMIALGVALTL